MSRKISTPPIIRPSRSRNTALETQIGTASISGFSTVTRTFLCGSPVSRLLRMAHPRWQMLARKTS
jgi:hypothetical protein